MTQIASRYSFYEEGAYRRKKKSPRRLWKQDRKRALADARKALGDPHYGEALPLSDLPSRSSSSKTA